MKYEPRNPRIISSRSQSQRRQGSALVLVVVLVVLLALMGIGFLFAMRAARVQASGAGMAALPQGSWPAVNEADYTAAIGNVVADVNTRVREGVLAGTPAVYLNPTNPESRYTAPRDSLYLADRFPISDFDATHVATDLPLLRWGFISALQTGAVRDTTTTTPPYANQDIYISQWVMGYPAAGAWPLMADGVTPYPTWAQEGLSARTRVFPAFTISTNKAYATSVVPADNAFKFFGADADGDGIADSVLTQIPVTGTLVGTTGTVNFWRGVRVIDNNAALNINTAWRSTADRDFAGADIAPTNELYGYLGAFRSNIGLRELIAGEAANAAVTSILGQANAETDMTLVETFRHNGNSATLQNVYSGNDAAATGTQVAGYQYLTMGDSLEHGLSRRYQRPTSVTLGFYSANDRFSKFQERTHDQLAFRFIFANPDFTAGDLITRLPMASRLYAPNVWNGTVVPQSQYFGANQADFWTYTNLVTDDTATESRATFFSGNASPNYPLHPAFTLANVLKTAKPHLVGENGVTVSTPAVDLATVVTPNQNSASWTTTMADYADTPRKAWVNGATFGELWRSYYDAFKVSGANPVQVTRYETVAPSLPTWSVDKQLVLRAAIAAVNTMQARLAPTANAIAQTVDIGGTSVKIFGAKRQPFITEVAVHTDLVNVGSAYDATTNPLEVKWVAIELHNPYNVAISIANQHLFLVGGTPITWKDVATLSGSIPAGGFVTVVANRNTDPTHVPTITGTSLPMTDPASVLADIAGRSVRLVAFDAGTPATANGFDMIPQDEVSTATVSVDDGTHNPIFYRYVRPSAMATIPAAAPATYTRFVCVLNDPANVFSKNADDTALTLGVQDNGTAPIIQVGNYEPFKPIAVVGSAFPYQGFARDGDILHAAFIGNYSYGTDPTTAYTCSVGRDAFFAEDGDASNNFYEPVGRFVPLGALDVAGGATYDWAARIFDFVTAVQHPGSDRTPDVPTAAEQLTYNGRSVQGKVNINTAGWETLAALPLIPMNPNVPAIANVDLAHAETVKLAKAIVAYRLANGPFTSIFDLNKVPEFAWRTSGIVDANTLLNQDLFIAPTDAAKYGYGDISSGTTAAAGDNAIGDFEQRLNGLTRISNLITTRSDSFTVYIVVQAWLAEPGNPAVRNVLVGERRAMYLMDRTSLTKGSPTFTEYQLLLKP